MRKTAAECRDAGVCQRCQWRPRERGHLCDLCWTRVDTWKKNNKEKLASYTKRYSQSHPEKRKEFNHKFYWINAEKCRTKAAFFGKRHRAALKLETFEAYGGVRCACCGEGHILFLTLDHIDNNGAQHRKSLGLTGYQFYRYLKGQGWPQGFQVLCFNCNCAKALSGCCPHQAGASVMLGTGP